ncbi:ATP-dependent sacrificial sulfur transferase LarE [Nitrospina watsonii]|uniref:Pyridinium-3,5-bisthiocarboxylic acid mononucleotide synthase n=1 Tax=Nitrospina watsonii TaxID=1323948 RepID=A0ABM9HCE4_9BACT|nr:ATP-dependent sacrificial sulfur transferase LarE [Nitrospina watsonii]CAI2717729.1 putative Pyridinium-3,5-bisthiocarboxylic acid mononucleotide synthase [Nitrospina watsonii]
MTLQDKHNQLRAQIGAMPGALVAFSGGVDSTLVLAVAHAELGERALAVTGRSPSVPERELNASRDLAAHIGAEHVILDTAEIHSPDYTANPANRCYFCKSELYGHLKRVAAERRIPYILNGTNTDDLGDHRPGLVAADEAQVISPLSDSGLSKQDVRDLSQQLGLPTWDKPAMACLASRVPYGQEVTREKLGMIEQAEDFLIGLGFRQLRVRHHGDVARIEVPQDDLPMLLDPQQARRIETRFRELGFQYVTVDILGFRSGSLNEVLR